MTAKKAPVFFTIAALRHEPIPAFESLYWPKVHDQLRKNGYSGNVEVEDAPIFGHGLPAALQLPAEMKSRTWTVFTPERHQAFSFSDSGVFSYHTSQYTTRHDLFAAFQEGLEVLHNHLQLQTYLGVGVRMLDLVRPSDTDQQFADYLQPSLMGFLGLPPIRDNWNPEITSLHQRFVDGDAEVAARFDCLPNNFGIQMDLFAAVKGHALPEFVMAAPGRPHGILDIDSHTHDQQPKPFDVDVVIDALAQHKNRISSTFYAATTPVAHTHWGLMP